MMMASKWCFLIFIPLLPIYIYTVCKFAPAKVLLHVVKQSKHFSICLLKSKLANILPIFNPPSLSICYHFVHKRNPFVAK